MNVTTEQLVWVVAVCWYCGDVSTVSNFRMGQLGLAKSTANVNEAEGNK